MTSGLQSIMSHLGLGVTALGTDFAKSKAGDGQGLFLGNGEREGGGGGGGAKKGLTASASSLKGIPSLADRKEEVSTGRICFSSLKCHVWLWQQQTGSLVRQTVWIGLISTEFYFSVSTKMLYSMQPGISKHLSLICSPNNPVKVGQGGIDGAHAIGLCKGV